MSRKLIIGAAIMAVTLIGFTAIGFAIAYTGEASNTDNTAEARYYTVHLDVDKDGTYDEAGDFTNAFSGKIYYDTVNVLGTITYTAHNVTEVDGEDCVLLHSMNVKVNGASGDGSYDDYVLSVTHESTIVGDYKISVTIGGVETVDDFSNVAGEGFDIDVTGAAETIITIDLYAVVDSPTSSAPVQLYSDETFTITAAATV